MDRVGSEKKHCDLLLFVDSSAWIRLRITITVSARAEHRNDGSSGTGLTLPGWPCWPCPLLTAAHLGLSLPLCASPATGAMSTWSIAGEGGIACKAGLLAHDYQRLTALEKCRPLTPRRARLIIMERVHHVSPCLQDCARDGSVPDAIHDQHRSALSRAQR